MALAAGNRGSPTNRTMPGSPVSEAAVTGRVTKEANCWHGGPATPETARVWAPFLLSQAQTTAQSVTLSRVREWGRARPSVGLSQAPRPVEGRYTYSLTKSSPPSPLGYPPGSCCLPGLELKASNGSRTMIRGSVGAESPEVS